MPDFLTNVDVSDVLTYPTTPQIVLGFQPDEILLRNRSAEATIFVSFNGLGEDDIELPPQSDPLSAQNVRTKNQKLWVRSGDESHTDTVRLLIEATTEV
jgi:hypothetical protein